MSIFLTRSDRRLQGQLRHPRVFFLVYLFLVYLIQHCIAIFLFLKRIVMSKTGVGQLHFFEEVDTYGRDRKPISEYRGSSPALSSLNLIVMERKTGKQEPGSLFWIVSRWLRILKKEEKEIG